MAEKMSQKTSLQRLQNLGGCLTRSLSQQRRFRFVALAQTPVPAAGLVQNGQQPEVTRAGKPLSKKVITPARGMESSRMVHPKVRYDPKSETQEHSFPLPKPLPGV